jgi:hypothetical protein
VGFAGLLRRALIASGERPSWLEIWLIGSPLP